MNGPAPVRGTAAVLTFGTLVSAACFVVGFGLALLGGDTTAADPKRLDQVVAAALELRPWGWSMLGVLVLLATPAIGLAVSFAEMRPTQPRSAGLALVVLAILGVATLVAIAGS